MNTYEQLVPLTGPAACTHLRTTDVVPVLYNLYHLLVASLILQGFPTIYIGIVSVDINAIEPNNFKKQPISLEKPCILMI